METRANYVLIGFVTLIAILAGLGFFLWLAKAQIDKTYADYDILFDSVAGLGKASPVKFNGVEVGQVLTIQLDSEDPSRVRVRIEVAAETPIRQGTVATLESQGVTGVSFVGLEGGTPDAARLEIDPFAGVPVIPSKPSVLQGVIQTAPDLLNEAIKLLRDLTKFTTDENRQAFTNILKNAEQASQKLDKAMDDVSRVADAAGKVGDEISQFADRLNNLANNVDGTVTTARQAIEDASKRIDKLATGTDGTVADAKQALADLRTRVNTVADNADAALISAKETVKALSARIDALAANADTAIVSVRDSMKGFENFSRTGLPRITALSTDASRMVDSITRLVAQISRDPARFFLGNRTPEYNR